MTSLILNWVVSVESPICKLVCILFDELTVLAIPTKHISNVLCYLLYITLHYSSSMLVTLETVPGNYEYICQSIQRTASGTTLLATGNATSSVMVKGDLQLSGGTSIL